MRLALLLFCAMLASQTWAQGYPAKPVRVVVPYPPGGPPDITARMLTPGLAAQLGQPVLVENRPGAGGVVGSAYVAKAAPDGYTLLFTTSSHTATPPFNENVPFDPVKDFTHVTLVAQNFGQALIVPPSSPARNLQELIAIARQNPGKLNYGTAGIGTASHIPAEMMKAMTGTDIVTIQYKGTPELMSDLFSGRIDLFFVGTQVAAQHVKSGKVRVLALTGTKRWKGLPDVPTMQEAGVKDFNFINWFGLWLPAGAAPELVTRLHAETVKALADPALLKQFDVQGLEAVGMPPAQFASFVAKDAAFINDLARKINAKK